MGEDKDTTLKRCVVLEDVLMKKTLALDAIETSGMSNELGRLKRTLVVLLQNLLRRVDVVKIGVLKPYVVEVSVS